VELRSRKGLNIEEGAAMVMVGIRWSCLGLAGHTKIRIRRRLREWVRVRRLTFEIWLASAPGIQHGIGLGFLGLPLQLPTRHEQSTNNSTIWNCRS